MTGGSRGRPLILGHRGGDAEEENTNTVAAVDRAVAVGFDGVEIDVRVSDGELIARHDQEPASGDRPAARFADLLAETERTGIRLLIDFKSSGDPADEAGRLVQALAGVERPDLIVVSSFSVPFLDALARTGTAHALMPIVSLRRNFPRPRDLEQWAGASVLAAALVANPFLAWSLRRRDQRLLVWFGWMEWPWVIRAAARTGAWGLIVDRIDTARKAVRG